MTHHTLYFSVCYWVWVLIVWSIHVYIAHRLSIYHTIIFPALSLRWVGRTRSTLLWGIVNLIVFICGLFWNHVSLPFHRSRCTASRRSDHRVLWAATRHSARESEYTAPEITHYVG